MSNQQLEQFRALKNQITRFFMMYKFALDEMETKIEILKEEFQLLHDYNPIEHTKSRVKSLEYWKNAKRLSREQEFSAQPFHVLLAVSNCSVRSLCWNP